jgi:hypothetical protein
VLVLGALVMQSVTRESKSDLHVAFWSAVASIAKTRAFWQPETIESKSALQVALSASVVVLGALEMQVAIRLSLTSLQSSLAAWSTVVSRARHVAKAAELSVEHFVFSASLTTLVVLDKHVA